MKYMGGHIAGKNLLNSKKF